MMSASDYRGNIGHDTIMITVSEPKPLVIISGPQPTIEFIYIPRYGKKRNLKGKVLNVDPKDIALAIYINVAGRWWTKPYYNQPITYINSDNTFNCDITTGGEDELATEVAVYLITSKFTPPLISGDISLPKELNDKALTKITVTRTKDGTIYTKAQKKIKQIYEKPLDRLFGICYGPFRKNQNPDKNKYPNIEELKQDINFAPQGTVAVEETTWSATKNLYR